MVNGRTGEEKCRLFFAKFFCGSICCVILLIPGVLAAVFLEMGYSAEEGDSKNDFDQMARPCTVVANSHRDRDSTGPHGGEFCSDCYTYSFTTATSSDVHKSGEWCEKAECGDGIKVPGPFQDGQGVYCWSPKVNPPPSFYTCYNPACYKIIDPAHESKETVASKAGKLLVGWILMVVFLMALCPVLCFLAWWCTQWCTQRRKALAKPYVCKDGGTDAIGKVATSDVEETMDADACRE